MTFSFWNTLKLSHQTMPRARNSLPSAVSAMKDMLVHGKLSVWVASEDARGYTYIRIALGRSLASVEDKSPTPIIRGSRAWFSTKKEQS